MPPGRVIRQFSEETDATTHSPAIDQDGQLTVNPAVDRNGALFLANGGAPVTFTLPVPGAGTLGWCYRFVSIADRT